MQGAQGAQGPQGVSGGSDVSVSQNFSLTTGWTTVLSIPLNAGTAIMVDLTVCAISNSATYYWVGKQYTAMYRVGSAAPVEVVDVTSQLPSAAVGMGWQWYYDSNYLRLQFNVSASATVNVAIKGMVSTATLP